MQENLIPLFDLVGEYQLKFELTDISPQSSYFVATVAILDDFMAHTGVTLYVKITTKQICDLLCHSLAKIPISAELFEKTVLVSQLLAGATL